MSSAKTKRASVTVPTPPPIPEKKDRVSILTEAERLIYGDRQRTYGSPRRNLTTVAELWEAFLDQRIASCGGPGTFHLSCKDVALMLLLLKIARLANDPNHRDSLVDVAGYAGLAERVDEDE